ncbi:hypothetical protein [Streptomyces sp. bgisy029]|uniref:hypothetical protein n=1 Tax=Streptomyces sp. bgisy029 TaxID=3413771 RepID=UPI003D73E617
MAAIQESFSDSNKPTYDMSKFVATVCANPGFLMTQHGRGWRIQVTGNARAILIPERTTGEQYLNLIQKIYHAGWSPIPHPWRGEPSLAFEDITPSEACDLLLRIPWYQRKIDDRKVEEWAGAMVRGEWRTTHQGLAFDQNGMLYDGQHRLAAQLLVGITLRFSVARGIQGDTFATVDRGKMRSSAYTFSAEGEKDTFNLSAALRLLWMWENSPVTSWKNRQPVSDDQLRDVLKRHPEIRHSVRRGKPIPKASGRATTLIHYLATQACGSPEIPDQWYAQLSSGYDFQQRDPGLVLRNYFLGGEDKDKTTRVPVRSMQSVVQVLFLFATAWNNTCTGQQRKIVKAFPDYGVPKIRRPGSNHLFRFPFGDLDQN